MEWINELKGKTVGLDTAPLIYYIEENPVYFKIVHTFFQAMERGDFKVITSTITLLEVLVHPFRKKDITLAEEYRDILLNSKLIMSNVSEAIAEYSAQLRAGFNIRTPDAIQIAASLNAGATFFFTNDIKLPEIPNLKILSLDNLS